MVAAFELAPWAEKGESGLVHGVTIDIFNAISKRSGLPIKFVLVPYKQMLRLLEYGQVDMSVFFKSQYSETITDPIVKVHDEENIVIGLKGTNLDRYEDLSNLRIATPRGVSYSAGLDQDQRLTKIQTKGYRQSINMLRKNRVNAVVGQRTALCYNFEKVGIKIEDLGRPFILGHKEAWLQISKKFKNPEVRSKLKKAVQELTEEGAFDKILSSYFANKN